MQGLSTPLVVAAAAFLLIMLWRVRPALPWGGRRRASREALREARERVEFAPAAPARPRGPPPLTRGARQPAPRWAVSVARALAALANRPRALESLLWRH